MKTIVTLGNNTAECRYELEGQKARLLVGATLCPPGVADGPGKWCITTTGYADTPVEVCNEVTQVILTWYVDRLRALKDLEPIWHLTKDRVANFVPWAHTAACWEQDLNQDRLLAARKRVSEAEAIISQWKELKPLVLEALETMGRDGRKENA